MNPHVLAVSLNPVHGLSKPVALQIQLLAGLGVAGDAHCGATVKHRSRVARNASLPNLRQVHLMHAELFDELRAQGFDVSPGEVGENITTRGLDLLALPRDTLLRIGPDAVVRVTGLRNPCVQLDRFQAGLTGAMLGRANGGGVVRKSGVMGVVVADGVVVAGDTIVAEWPAVQRPLECV